jgi:hypothetical protein
MRLGIAIAFSPFVHLVETSATFGVARILTQHSNQVKPRIPDDSVKADGG